VNCLYLQIFQRQETHEVKLDADSLIIEFNRGAEKISGYSAQEVLGKNWFKIFIPNDDLPEILKIFSDIFLGKNHHWEHTNEIFIKSGETVKLKWTYSHRFPIANKKAASLYS